MTKWLPLWMLLLERISPPLWAKHLEHPCFKTKKYNSAQSLMRWSAAWNLEHANG